jgi:hypothetical protein
VKNILDLIPAFNKDSDEIPEPGTEGNEWIGVKRIVNGQEVFHAFSGRERRRITRAHARYEAKRQRAGERAYNRQARKAEFNAGTRRAQLAILRGEVQVTPAMMDNLTNAIQREQAAYDREQNAEELATNAQKRRSERAHDRRVARFAAGKPRGKDLRYGTFADHSMQLPADLAGVSQKVRERLF